MGKEGASAVIYALLSSEGDRQVADLQSYAESAGLKVTCIFSEKPLGAGENRPVLDECLDWCCNNNADTLLVSEISRLGHTAKVIVDNIARLTKAGVNIYLQDLNINTIFPSGEENATASQMVAMLGLGAKMERRLTAERLNSGRKHAMEKGVIMGRKRGYRKTREQKEKEYAEVIRLLKKGVSIRNTAKQCGVSPKTVQAVKNEFIKSK